MPLAVRLPAGAAGRWLAARGAGLAGGAALLAHPANPRAAQAASAAAGSGQQALQPFLFSGAPAAASKFAPFPAQIRSRLSARILKKNFTAIPLCPFIARLALPASHKPHCLIRNV